MAMSRGRIEFYKEHYPRGTRVQIDSMGDDPNPVPNGSKGVVSFVDDCGTVFVNFDNGRSLGICPDVDSFHKIAEQTEVGKAAFRNEQKYGAATWYDWARENWGSKWNAYQTERLEDNTIEFNTAWSNVKPVIFALSEKFPDIEMHYQWADEDIGSNVGDVTFKGGEYIENIDFEPCSKEAYEFAAEMWGGDLEDEGLIFNETTGTYEWQDTDETESPNMS